MHFPRLSTLVCSLALISAVQAERRTAEVSSLKPSDIREFDEQPAAIQQLLEYSLDLTRKNLAYQYGSCDPATGGMDCSGTVHHILVQHGFKAPRASNTLYLWVEKGKNLHKVKNATKVTDSQLRHLKPGDLLFWEGTYNVGKRNPPTSHVMIFLGHRKSNGSPVMVGASSGRYYDGRARHGVSVFDFVMPRATSKSKFVGYGAVPGLEREKIEKPLQGVVARIMDRVNNDPPAPESGPPESVEAEDPAAAPETSPAQGLGNNVLERLRKMEEELKSLRDKLDS
ncbi:MAG: NlpC/P60 family protein [Verrucomicrobiota bacterium]